MACAPPAISYGRSRDEPLATVQSPEVVTAPRPSDATPRAMSTRTSWLFRGRIVLGCLLLALCWVLTVEWWSAVVYLAALHQHLGAGLAAAFAALWVLVLSLVMPLGVWAALPALRRAAASGRHGVALLIVVLAAGLVWVATSHLLAGTNPSASSEERIADAELELALSSLSHLGRRLSAGTERQPSLLTSERVSCPKPPNEQPVTVVATFVDRDSRPVSACFQARDLPATLLELSAALLDRARRGPVALEVVSGWQSLPRRHAWLDILKLRPGLDGVCHDGSCLMPWQLLAHGFFSTHRPLRFIPDLQFGASPRRLREALGASPEDNVGGLVRVTTRSYVLDLSDDAASAPASLTPLVRMRRREVPLTQLELEQAEGAAETHILQAQQADGKFRYTLDPMTGAADTRGFNLARQAGTTLVLCELGRTTPEVQRGIELALASFGPFARERGPVVALSSDPQNPLARLGESALPLVSLLACASRVGLSVSPHIAGLSRFILQLQREDGGFAPALDFQTGTVQSGPEPLYAAGQAIMALVLLERRQQLHPTDHLPTYEVVHEAVERGMEYVATRYWSHPLRDFFFLEENWHCLAARAALGVHRHRGYEDFCTDYVRFKSRLILEKEQGADADFDGGFGFGNIIPPHNTGAAGLGEALAAAIALHRAQDQRDTTEELNLGRVMRFLLRQQWSRENCFACATPEVLGGMSEHTHSMLTRIDFVQHAWAALGHGRRVLGPSLPPE